MTEVLKDELTPQQKVFGEAFSFEAGPASEAAQTNYFKERLAAIREGKTTWLSRALDGEQGVVADLYIESKPVATLEFDYDLRAASVYTTSEGGRFGDTTLCDQVSFDEAVAQAEQIEQRNI